MATSSSRNDASRSRSVVAEFDRQAGRELRVAARASVHAQRERERRGTDVKTHRVSQTCAAEQRCEVLQPVSATCIGGEDAAQPVGQRRNAAHA